MPADKPANAKEASKSPDAFVAWTEELLALEQAAEDEETTELLTTLTHTELQARGIVILKLCVGEQTTALYGRTSLTLEKAGGANLPAHRISHGDIVGLFDQSLRPLSKAVPLASAVVQRVRPNSVAVVFDGDVPTEVLDGRQLHLATVSSDVTMRRYKEAMDLLSSGRYDGPAEGLVAVCFGEGTKPRFHEAKTEGCERPDAVDAAFKSEQAEALNEPQQAAVVKSILAKDVAVIHGPPGTGKTTTLVAYILEAAYRKQRLLVTAPSNVAVDNLLERVLDCGFRSVVRLGHPARVQSDLHGFTMDNVLYASEQAALCRDIKKEIDDALKKSGPSSKAKERRAAAGELNALRKELRQRERQAVAEVLKHTQVVFATCAGAATLHREIRRGGAGSSRLEFDVAIVDEAAQALEVACWIPLLLGKKAVLAGDHQQLSACVKSTEAQKRGLDHTLFARIIDMHGDDAAALLSIQYRMNSIIMGWSSRNFYGERLAAADSVAERLLALNESPAHNLVGEVVDAMRAPLLFVDTAGLPQYREDGAEEPYEGKKAQHQAGTLHQSRSNPGEAGFVSHYAKMLVRCGIHPKDITIITPYNRQVEQLVASFAGDTEGVKLGLEKPRINTVDSFQGQEADAVLISLVRSNERGVVGFLSDFRRLNVAVTRARKHVMLVGDAATISTDDTLASLYDYACEAGKVVFVQQLLDEEGKVPPDPAEAAAQAQQTKEMQQRSQKLDAGKERRHEKVQDEDALRARFEAQLAPLKDGGCHWFPSNLNPYERAIAHEAAGALGLQHESKGEGMGRRLCVWATGHEPAWDSMPTDEAATKRSQGGKGATAKKGAAGRPEKAGDENEAKAEEEEQETALEAFERRAADLINALGPAQPAAEWKAPTADELAVLERLAEAAGLEVVATGSGKKRRARVEVEAEAGAAAASASASSTCRAGAQGRVACASASDSLGASAAASGNSANATLAQLHLERQRREAEKKAREAEERKKANEAVKMELRQAKKASKDKKPSANKDQDGDDDLDALLDEFTQCDDTCAFGACKEKIHTLMDMIAKCAHCKQRFCLKHVQAEVHGCGDSAKRAEQKKFKEAHNTSKGSGLVNKSAENRGALAGKLQARIQGQEANRTTKAKDKKK